MGRTRWMVIAVAAAAVLVLGAVGPAVAKPPKPALYTVNLIIVGADGLSTTCPGPVVMRRQNVNGSPGLVADGQEGTSEPDLYLQGFGLGGCFEGSNNIPPAGPRVLRITYNPDGMLQHLDWHFDLEGTVVDTNAKRPFYQLEHKYYLQSLDEAGFTMVEGTATGTFWLQEYNRTTEPRWTDLGTQQLSFSVQVTPSFP